MKKAIFSLFALALMLLLLTLCVGAASEMDIPYAVEGGNIYFDKNYGVVTYADPGITKADIPAEIDGVAVRWIAFGAFDGCTLLTDVTIAEGVSGIGERAFGNCSSLRSIDLPDSITEIGKDVLYESAYFYDKNNWDGAALYLDHWLIDADISALSGDYEILPGTTGIAVGALNSCGNLTGITIPDSVTYINLHAFSYSGLSTATIPEGVSKLSDYAFGHCKELQSITLPNTLTEIGYCTFAGCIALKDLTIPDSVTKLGEQAFYASGLEQVQLPDKLTAIPKEAFYSCRSLTYIYIPDSVTEIHHGAFNNCAQLKNIYVGSGVKMLHDAAFCGDMPKNRSINFRGDAPQIGEHVFESFNWETSERFLEEGLCLYYYEGKQGWTSPQWNGYPCMAMKDKYALGVEGGYLYFSREEQAITGCDSTVTKLIIPAQIQGIEVRSIYGYAFSGNSTLTSVTFPGSIRYIDDCAFRNCTALKELNFPEGLKSIDDGAFIGCTALKQVTLPNSLNHIGRGAFQDCTALASISLGNNVTWIYDGAFDNTAYFADEDNWEDGLLYLGKWMLAVGEGLEEIHVKAGTVGIAEWSTDGSKDSCKELTFPGSLRYVCDHAFYGYRQLTQIVVPKQVRSFGSYAFQDCPNLEAAYFYGDAPDFGPDAFLCWAPYPVFRESHVTFYYAEGTEGWLDSEPHIQDYFHPTPWDPTHAHSYVDNVCRICGAGKLYGDVPSNVWYTDAVEFAVVNGLMNGMSDTTFEPEANMTRAMLVTVLWRYAGSPVAGENSFTDVEDGLWYTRAIAWAAHEGIVGGVGNNRFDPDGLMTREQLATVLYRYSRSMGIDVSEQVSLDPFPDAASVSSWAKDAVTWAVAEGLINGSDGKLLPQGYATRAQVATILMRFIENVL